MPWLSLLPTLIGLIPGLNKSSPSHGDQLTTLLQELTTAYLTITAGFQPPRDLSSILADINLLVGSIPADLASQIPGFANIQADVAKFSTFVTDLNGGQEVVVPGSLTVPGVTSKVRACLFAHDVLGL